MAAVGGFEPSTDTGYEPAALTGLSYTAKVVNRVGFAPTFPDVMGVLY